MPQPAPAVSGVGAGGGEKHALQGGVPAAGPARLHCLHSAHIAPPALLLPPARLFFLPCRSSTSWWAPSPTRHCWWRACRCGTSTAPPASSECGVPCPLASPPALPAAQVVLACKALALPRPSPLVPPFPRSQPRLVLCHPERADARALAAGGDLGLDLHGELASPSWQRCSNAATTESAAPF